ncbi:SDR family NAD(P)-dependent oxidoreductase [Paraburkholderia tropica]|uniref:SDR family NAD(P)-dependent oxidoreductase n=1 Tax=Paraburkholderia tropica TaxID=92647 RepID=UPI002ABDA265|nr:SDR family oxidoreductase [Paraburkholderia tropica]
MQRYAGKTVLVTGAAGGLGSAMCLRFAAEGARVAALDVDNLRLETACAQWRELGHNIRPFLLDVTDASAFKRQVESIVEEFGRLDVAVNNAGMGGDMAPLAEYPLATWERVMSVNVSSVFYGMRAQIPTMCKQGHGAIINVASIMGSIAMPSIAPYVASKHAVVGLTKGAALDYGRAGVRINAVGPSFVRTGFTASSLPDDSTWDALADRHALAGTASPEDIAATVAYLGSEDARFVTGALYLVDGGYTAT